ncbi:hypothetical protein [Halomonas sp. NO4]|uniref:hypothetical protein n=1 Tax=Halomonas sp. NO4 TaxID=2484813 RepID=UPI0013D1E4C8|nr:hypothetical protein [Halomonas sp. NO4]
MNTNVELALQANTLHEAAHALDLPAGSDVTSDVVPAIHALKAERDAARAEEREARRQMATMRGG